MNYIGPDNTLHQSFVDIEPVTGKALRKAVRLQVRLIAGHVRYLGAS